jgi:hypothetical protein
MSQEDTLKAACRRDRLANDKTSARNELTHEILESQDEPEIKVMRLHTECGFGTMRAQELVYGAAKPRQTYKNKEYTSDKSRFYAKGGSK